MFHCNQETRLHSKCAKARSKSTAQKGRLELMMRKSKDDYGKLIFVGAAKSAQKLH
jgi:hypothetical protein